MKKLLLFAFVLAVVAACSKDKFQTKPQVEIKSISPDHVAFNTNLRVTLGFNDKEGDVSDTLTLYRQRLNRRGLQLDSFHMVVPPFPAADEGEIIVDMNYTTFLTVGLTAIPLGTARENDTLALKFVLRDKAGNRSDTAKGNVIVQRIP
jgi:hypothetical protein